MKKTVSPSPIITDPASYRIDLAENQQTFWARFGITQSGGSRYESGNRIPPAVRLMLALYASGVIDDKALRAARKTAGLPRLPGSVVAPLVQKRHRRTSAPS